MSATNRGAERVEDDAYPTPAWAVHRLLEGIEKAYPNFPGGHWHEVAAGAGGIIRAVNDFRPELVQQWSATELREYPELLQVPRLSLVRTADYLIADPIRSHVSISNPAFSIAQQTIQKALTESDWVVMLLRMNFLGSDARASWLRTEMPDIFTLPDRPNFIASYKCKPRDKHDKGCGWSAKLPIAALGFKVCPTCGRKVQRSTSDSAEYGWMVWTPERGRTAGLTHILESTPEEVRKVVREERAAA